MRLSFGLEESCASLKRISEEHGLPKPRSNPAPFNHEYTEFLRVVGPGVFVGMAYQLGDVPTGWRTTFGRPLHFVMIRVSDG